MLRTNFSYALFLSLLLAPAMVLSQNVAINNDGKAPNINAMLDINSDSKGLLIPRLDSNTRKAIPNTLGLLLYDTDTHCFWYNNGSAWINTGLINPDNSTAFWGFRAGQNNQEHSNSGFGALALNSNTTGTYNTAVGSKAMQRVTVATENTAVGAEAMLSTTTGTFNTAIGSASLFNNVNGNSNTAVGAFSLFSNTSAIFNTAVGYLALSGNISGASNTSLGSESLRLNTTGFLNTASGAQAMFFNTAGSRNSAHGYRAGYNNTVGNDNTSMGYEAIFSNSSGQFNTAMGSGALRANTTGHWNTAIGYQAMLSNTNGQFNTAIGFGALAANQTGQANSAIGIETLLHNTTGNNNVAIGDIALEDNTVGDYNVAVGGASLLNNTTGTRNAGLGDRVMETNHTGSNNTAIGYGADVGFNNLTNATVIGSQAVVDASNKVRIGNPGVTVIEGQVPFTTPSDGRFKFNVQEDVKGLDFILQLRPVSYQFNVEQFDAQWKKTDDKTALSRRSVSADNARIDFSEALKMRRIGFIAQEVEQAAKTSSFNFSGIVKPKTAGEHYGLSYESFVVPLVKAIQEQEAIITELQHQVSELRLLIQKAN